MNADINKKATLLINEQHSLMPDQEMVLQKTFPQGWNEFRVPSQGLTLTEMTAWVSNIEDPTNAVVIMVSPIPAMFCLLAKKGIEFRALHNDHRVAKEVPDGKGGVRLIHTVAPEGWQLV